MRKSIDRWKEFTVYTFEFESPTDLCNYVKWARLNTRVFPKEMIKNEGSEGSDTTKNGGGWYQTRNLKEAIKLCKNGWNEGFDFFKTLKKSLEATGDRIYFFPADEADTVNLYVELSYQWETTKQAIVNRGVIIQNLIKQLEEKDYKVNLNAFAIVYYGTEMSNIIVNLKSKDEELDPKKTYFAFCNPSFLRRLIFRVMESTDFKEIGWNEGYGYVCDAETIKKFYKTSKLDIVIPQAYEIGINGENINKDWKTFLIYEKLQKYFND